MPSHRTSLRLAASCLALGLSALAAPAFALANFGAFVDISTTGGIHATEGGAGAGSVSRTYSSASPDGASSIVGYGAADLFGGTLHASSLATIPLCTRDHCDSNSVRSRAVLWDSVTFFNKDGSARESLALIPQSIKVDGNMAGDTTEARFRAYSGYDANYDVDALAWQDLGSGNLEVYDNLVVPLTDSPLYVYIEIETYAQTNGHKGFALSDFGNTLHFNWELPDDLAMQSASGVFLTQMGSAVPEPQTWALMLLGFGSIGAVLRRDRARRLAEA